MTYDTKNKSVGKWWISSRRGWLLYGYPSWKSMCKCLDGTTRSGRD